VSRVFLAALLLGMAGAYLSACGNSHSGGVSLGSASIDSTSAVPAAPGSRMAIAGQRPIDAYVQLGGRIKSCWFNPDGPLLPNHVYRANVSADGGTVLIAVHEKQPLGRAGLLAYLINFKQDGGYTLITTSNRAMPAQLAAKMQFDIERWKRGETNCSRAMPPVAALPSGQ